MYSYRHFFGNYLHDILNYADSCAIEDQLSDKGIEKFHKNYGGYTLTIDEADAYIGVSLCGLSDRFDRSHGRREGMLRIIRNKDLVSCADEWVIFTPDPQNLSSDMRVLWDAAIKDALSIIYTGEWIFPNSVGKRVGIIVDKTTNAERRNKGE